MKRSLINQSIKKSIRFFEKAKISLPPFAFWNEAEFIRNKLKAKEIIETRLGWDVTDAGKGDFLNTGRIIFTVRNGIGGSKKYDKPYCQKIMCLLEGQSLPIHYHKSKVEDIINHYGGNIIVKLWKKTKTNKLSKSKIECSINGIKTRVKAGEKIRLKPGESIWIKRYTYHQFWAEPGFGKVASGEISSINDDLTDNHWIESVKRFPKVKEDEPRKYILCSEYKKI